MPNSSICELLVCEAHGGGLMGHFGVRKTLDMLHEHFFFFCQRGNVMWRELVLDALPVGRPNLESYHMDYTLLCQYLVHLGSIFL